MRILSVIYSVVHANGSFVSSFSEIPANLTEVVGNETGNVRIT